MTPLQELLLSMLEEIDAICHAHGLDYYVAGGTTLGAMRRQGFIPWDDDVDIMMPNADWKRFLQLAREGALPEGRALCCRELYPEYPNAMPRYVDLATTFIHPNQLLDNLPSGVSIDVFVLDGVPDGKQGYQQHRATLSLFTDLANPLGYSYPLTQDSALLEAYEKRIREEGRTAVLDELEAQLEQHDYDSCDYVVMRWGSAPRLFKREFFAFERREDFEGLCVQMPALANDYLVQHYGDDWTHVPPSPGRATHDALLNLNADYASVRADYLARIDVERTKQAILRRRSYHIRHRRELLLADELIAGMASLFAVEVTLKRAETLAAEGVQEDAGRPSPERLEWVFEQFYRWQLDALFAGREDYDTVNRFNDPMLIDIGDDLLAVALDHLIETNRLGQAGRILRIREHAAGPLGGVLEEVSLRLQDVRLAPSLADVGFAQEALESARDTLRRQPANFSNRVFLSTLLAREGAFDELHDVAEAGRALYPEAGEFEKFLADCALAQAETPQQKEAAFQGYLSALRATTNEFVYLDAHRRIEADHAFGQEHFAQLDQAFAQSVQHVPATNAARSACNVPDPATQLLAEAAQTCEELGIEHYLGPTSARLACAFGQNQPGLCELDLLVPAEHLPTLAEALKTRTGATRALDSWLSNKSYLRFQLDYVDTQTTFLQLDEGTDIAAHGYKLNILPIRSCTPKSSALKNLEEGWQLNGHKLTKAITPKRAALAAYARGAMAMGRRRLARRLFAALSDDAAWRGSDEARFVLKGNDVLVGTAELSSPTQLEFAGVRYAAPGHVEQMLESCFGENWLQDTLAMKPAQRHTLMAPDLPYETLLAQLKEKGLAPKRLFSLMTKIRLNMLPLANDLRIRNRAFKLARESNERLAKGSASSKNPRS